MRDLPDVSSSSGPCSSCPGAGSRDGRSGGGGTRTEGRTRMAPRGLAAQTPRSDPHPPRRERAPTSLSVPRPGRPWANRRMLPRHGQQARGGRAHAKRSNWQRVCRAPRLQGVEHQLGWSSVELGCWACGLGTAPASCLPCPTPRFTLRPWASPAVELRLLSWHRWG